MKEYHNVIVDCKRITYNPCALDEYEVIIKPTNGKPQQTIYTYAGMFESNEAICGRVYLQWLKESKL
jgi:hypothetical protein